jgi:hypothetical protein
MTHDPWLRSVLLILTHRILIFHPCFYPDRSTRSRRRRSEREARRASPPPQVLYPVPRYHLALLHTPLSLSESPSVSTLAVGVLFTLSCVLPLNFTNTGFTTTNHSAEGQSYSNYGGGGDLLDLMDDEPASMSTPMSHSAPGDISYHCLALIREFCFAETVLYSPSLHPLHPHSISYLLPLFSQRLQVLRKYSWSHPKWAMECLSLAL